MDEKQSKFMSTVKVGPKSQIVIPKEVRDMFDIQPGDSLVLMADIDRGIAIQKANVLSKIADAIFDGQGKEVLPNEQEEHRRMFADEIRKQVKGDGEEQ